MSKIKHGYYASFFEETLIALGEHPGEFAQLRQDLLNYWTPADAFRRLLVERLARLMWQLQRGECQQETALARRLRGLARTMWRLGRSDRIHEAMTVHQEYRQRRDEREQEASAARRSQSCQQTRNVKQNTRLAWMYHLFPNADALGLDGSITRWPDHRIAVRGRPKIVKMSPTMLLKINMIQEGLPKSPTMLLKTEGRFPKEVDVATILFVDKDLYNLSHDVVESKRG